MPVYEFKCLKCLNKYDIKVSIQAYSDKPIWTCDGCGGELKRQWSPLSINIK